MHGLLGYINKPDFIWLQEIQFEMFKHDVITAAVGDMRRLKTSEKYYILRAELWAGQCVRLTSFAAKLASRDTVLLLTEGDGVDTGRDVTRDKFDFGVDTCFRFVPWIDRKQLAGARESFYKNRTVLTGVSGSEADSGSLSATPLLAPSLLSAADSGLYSSPEAPLSDSTTMRRRLRRGSTLDLRLDVDARFF